ncbi:MAG: DUF937 domain-containing protein [Saprospiraceae bacterium]
MSPLEILAQQLSGSTMNQLSQRVGAQPQQTQAATAGIVQTLLGAMARNVQKDPSQADKIAGALERDNHAGLLDNLGSMLGGGSGASQNARSMNGMGILQHILGGSAGRVADQVSKSSGLNSNQVAQLMVTLAPIVMGALGKSKQQTGAQGGSGIASILGAVLGGGGLFGGTKSTPQQQPAGNRFLNAVLDRDGDGNTGDDLAQMGMQLLGGLFSR